MEDIVDTHEEDNGESAEVADKLGKMFSKFFGARRMSKVVRDTRKLMKFKGISADEDDEVCWRHEQGFSYGSKRRQSTYNDIVLSEQMSRASKNSSRRAMDFKFIGLEK